MTNKFDGVSLCHGHDCQILTADVCDMKIENASVDIFLILISRTFDIHTEIGTFVHNAKI